MTEHSAALRQFPYGLYVVGATREKQSLLILANWVLQASFSPPLIVLSIEIKSKMHEYIAGSGFFTINVLPSGNPGLARTFLKSQEVKDGRVGGNLLAVTGNGSPIVSQASAAVECRLQASHPAGDHTLFVGEVVWSIVNFDAAGMTLKESGLSYWKKNS